MPVRRVLVDGELKLAYGAVDGILGFSNADDGAARAARAGPRWPRTRSTAVPDAAGAPDEDAGSLYLDAQRIIDQFSQEARSGGFPFDPSGTSSLLAVAAALGDDRRRPRNPRGVPPDRLVSGAMSTVNPETGRRDFLFTSESVTEGHPDKMADQISDSVLDAVLADDPEGRVACETLVTTGLVVVAGEITTEIYVDIPKLVRADPRDRL